MSNRRCKTVGITIIAMQHNLYLGTCIGTGTVVPQVYVHNSQYGKIYDIVSGSRFVK